MKKFTDALKSNKILVCDGGMGTALQENGLKPGKAPEECNIAKPALVGKIHKSFIAAGCNMIITNTFGANPIKLKKAGLESKFLRINSAGAKIAKKAAGNSVYVLGDIGPTGDFLKPLGAYEEKDFSDAFLKQAEILHKNGADAFIIETMTSLEEIRLAVSACKKAADIPIIASMTFASGAKGYRTMMGVAIEDFAREMAVLKCDCIGANCGCGAKQMVEIMGQIKSALKNIGAKDIFLIAQPNAGMPKLVNGETVFDESPSDFALVLPDLVKLGANIIGGCCGTTPEHIREIVKIVKGKH